MRMLQPLVRAAFVCSLLVVVNCASDGDELAREESGGPLQWLHSLLPSTLVGRNPYFCKWYDCPTFNVTAKTWFYETRLYREVNWVTCPLPFRNMSLRAFERERKACFWALFNYISGDNSASTKIKMTVPVIERSSNGTAPFMGFFIPGSPDEVPTPNNSNLTIVVQQPASYHVRSFSGFGYNPLTRVDNWRIQTEILKKALQNHGETLGDTLTAASYDSPWHLFFRHNEVWIDADASN